MALNTKIDFKKAKSKKDKKTKKIYKYYKKINYTKD